MLGQPDQPQVHVIDTKEYDAENIIDSNIKKSIKTSIDRLYEYNGVNLYVWTLAGEQLYFDSDGHPQLKLKECL